MYFCSVTHCINFHKNGYVGQDFLISREPIQSTCIIASITPQQSSFRFYLRLWPSIQILSVKSKIYDIKCNYYRSLVKCTTSVHEISAGHRSLSGSISCVSDRIRFLPVTMTGRFSNFNSISYTEDWHELCMTGTKCRLPDVVSGTGEIFISGAGKCKKVLRKF